MTAKEMFMNIEKFGKKPRYDLYPLDFVIEDCDGDENCIKNLEHSINYTWRDKDNMRWICFDLDNKSWFAGQIDQEMKDLLNKDFNDLSHDEIMRLMLNNGWTFTKEENQAIFKQLKELGWV